MASWHSLDVPEQSRTATPEDLSRIIYYIDGRIQDFYLTIEEGQVTAVNFQISDEGDSGAAAQVQRKLSTMLRRQAGTTRKIRQRQIWRTAVESTIESDIYEQLKRTGTVFRSGEGQVAFGYPLTKLVGYFDHKLRTIASMAGATEYVYPTLIPTEVVDRCGYLDSFPHFLMFVNHLRADLDNYDAFTSQRTEPDVSRLVAEHYDRKATYCLPPTMCFHVYHHLAGLHLREGEQRVVTCRGKSFRHESRYERGLERLWDFTIRETVFIGDINFVRSSRETWSALTHEMLEGLGLEASCGLANDPFFAGTAVDDKATAQILMESKYEVRMRVGNGRSIAVASINYASDFFATRFGLTMGDSTHAKTGCVGFGLERLAFAFLCQYGLDERRWPQEIRAFDG